MKYKAISRELLADMYTPVGLYLSLGGFTPSQP